MSEKQKNPFPMYRGKPLVRSGDTIYYGNMTDKYVIKIDIKTKKTVEDMEVADKCIVQLIQKTDRKDQREKRPLSCFGHRRCLAYPRIDRIIS